MIKLPPDISFLIQLVGFLVFWQLMRAILFIPMQRVLKARAERTTGARARAEALIAEAAQIAGSVDAGLMDAKRSGAGEAERIRQRAEAEEQAILSRYRTQAAELLERERAATDAQISAARAPLEKEATQLAETVVTRVLGQAA